MRYYQVMDSPIDKLALIATDDGLDAIVFKCNWDAYQAKHSDLEEQSTEHLQQAKKELNEYFTGERKSFDVPLSIEGTDFQKQAWQALIDIPYGETRSYTDQAEMINNPAAVRAIGTANGANRIPIMIPCHRVIGKSGNLAGFAGGLDTKRYLLELEGVSVW